MDMFETRKSLLELEKLQTEWKSIQFSIKQPLPDVGYSLLDWLRRIMQVGSIGFFIYELIVQFRYYLSDYGQNIFQKVSSFLEAILVTFVYELQVVVPLLAVYYLIKFIVFMINFIKNHSRRAGVQRKVYLQKDGEILVRRDQIIEELKNSEVSVNYRNLDAIDWMIVAFNNKRGSTYGELVNLYERHLNDERQTNAVTDLQREKRELQIQLQQTNAEVLKAKKEAEIAKGEASSAKSAANWMDITCHLKK